MLKPESFSIWKKADVLIIVILGHLKINVEVLDISVEAVMFGKYREMSEVDDITNSILTIIYSKP